jgi:cell division protein FtsZ
MGIGIADGDRRAQDAAAQAVNSPLLDVSITGAKGVLFVVAGADDLGILEVQEAAKVVSDSVDPTAKVIFGIMRDEKLKKGQIRIIVIATGFPEGESSEHNQASIERSLFAMQPTEQTESRGKIYNDMGRREEAAPAPAPEPVREEESRTEKRREEPLVTAKPRDEQQPVQKTVTPPSAQNEADDEDEAWGAIPSFLRRHKK